MSANVLCYLVFFFSSLFSLRILEIVVQKWTNRLKKKMKKKIEMRKRIQWNAVKICCASRDHRLMNSIWSASRKKQNCNFSAHPTHFECVIFLKSECDGNFNEIYLVEIRFVFFFCFEFATNCVCVFVIRCLLSQWSTILYFVGVISAKILFELG